MARGVTSTPADERSDRIIVADDHPLFREAIGSAIRRLRAGACVVECDSVAALHAELGADGDAALVLLDLRLRDSDGFAGLLSLKACFPALPVAIVSATEDPETVANALICGAGGFIPKSAGLGELGEALAAILGGSQWTPGPKHSGRSAAPISQAQARILSGLQRGLMNKQIAFEIGVTEATVKSHLTGLFRRLGVRSRTEAMALARDLPAEP